MSAWDTARVLVKVLIMCSGSIHYCFPLVPFLNLNLDQAVDVPEIKCGEESGSLEEF